MAIDKLSNDALSARFDKLTFVGEGAALVSFRGFVAHRKPHTSRSDAQGRTPLSFLKLSFGSQGSTL